VRHELSTDTRILRKESRRDAIRTLHLPCFLGKFHALLRRYHLQRQTHQAYFMKARFAGDDKTSIHSGNILQISLNEKRRTHPLEPDYDL
jgi:hypothetical protein